MSGFLVIIKYKYYKAIKIVIINIVSEQARTITSGQLSGFNNKYFEVWVRRKMDRVKFYSEYNMACGWELDEVIERINDHTLL